MDNNNERLLLNPDSITNLSASGKIITYTKNDGTTGTIATQDTTYSNATISAAGLMSAADKTTLNTLNTLVGDTAVSTQISNAISGLPKPTIADSGKFVRVGSNGEYIIETVSAAEEVSF